MQGLVYNASSLKIIAQIMDWSLTSGKGEGLQHGRGGGQVKFYPYERGGGGGERNSFGPAIRLFCSPPPP